MTPLVAVIEIFLPFRSRFEVAASSMMPFLPSMRTLPSLCTTMRVPTESREMLQLSVPGFGRDALRLAVLVEKVDPVAVARDERAPVDGAGSRVDQFGALAAWRIHPVVEPAEYVRPLRVALLERHQYLVAYLGDDHRAAVFAGSGLHGAGPVADVVVGQPRKREFHPALIGRVVGVADLCDDDPVSPGPLAHRLRSARKDCVPGDPSPRTRSCTHHVSGRNGAARP